MAWELVELHGSKIFKSGFVNICMGIFQKEICSPSGCRVIGKERIFRYKFNSHLMLELVLYLFTNY